MGQSRKKPGRFIPARPVKKTARSRAAVFLLITALLASPVSVPGGYCACCAYRLVIKDFQSGRVLWQKAVKPGAEILYVHNHSVYGVEVRHKYLVSRGGTLVLQSVRSLPFVLFDPYPGYSLPYQEPAKDINGMVEVTIQRPRSRFILAVGDGLTRKKFIIGNEVLRLQNLGGDGKIIEVALMKD